MDGQKSVIEGHKNGANEYRKYYFVSVPYKISISVLYSLWHMQISEFVRKSRPHTKSCEMHYTTTTTTTTPV